MDTQYLRAYTNLKRTQIITQHDEGDLICEDTNLGFERSDMLLVIQIFSQGRTADTKQMAFGKLAEALKERCGTRGEDLIISCVDNTKADW